MNENFKKGREMKDKNENIPGKVKSLLFAFAFSIAFNIYALQKSSDKIMDMQIYLDSLIIENNQLRAEARLCLK